MPRLTEFIDGAARLRGGAKAIDVWRMETKLEVLFEEARPSGQQCSKASGIQCFSTFLCLEIGRCLKFLDRCSYAVLPPRRFDAHFHLGLKSSNICDMLDGSHLTDAGIVCSCTEQTKINSAFRFVSSLFRF